MTKRLVTLVSFIIVAISYAQQPTTADYFDLIRKDFNGELAYETVAYVEKYWRVAGNTGFNKTVYKIAQNLEKAGYVLESKANSSDRLTYRIEKRPMKDPTWEPVSASVQILGQDTLLLQQSSNRNMVYLNSVSTSKNGIIGEVIHVKSIEHLKTIDVTGKIVFAELSGRKLFKEAIENQSALGIVTYNNPSYLQPEINKTSIQFRSMPSQKNTKAWGIALSYAAKEALKTALAKGKVKLKVFVQTKMYPSEELTIIADIRGAKYADERFVFSAHIQEPGANDNASGVGAQLEMAVLTADLLQKGSLELNRTLTFLWGDEIISTNRYINEDPKRAKTIKWGVSLDMVGENTAITGGTFLIEKMPDPSAIWTRGNDKHTEWGGKELELKDMKPHYLNDFMLHTFKTQGKFTGWEVQTNPFEGGSDHTPFLKANIPGVLLWHFTDQFYHTDNDRIDKVSKQTLKNVGSAALVSCFTLLNADSSTGIELLQLIKKSAQQRLTDEYQLSLESIKSGNNIKEELKILKAWQDWYIKSIYSLSDVNSTNNTKFTNELELAVRNFKTSTEKQLKNLKKSN